MIFALGPMLGGVSRGTRQSRSETGMIAGGERQSVNSV